MGVAEWIALGGIILNVVFVLVLVPMNQKLKELAAADSALNTDIGALKVLVAGSYLTRSEFQQTITTMRDENRQQMRDQTALIEQLFSRLEKKIDGKADK